MAQVNLDNALEDGCDAVRRHGWRKAFDQLPASDRVVTINWK